jgi:hypothetical protein
MTMNRFYCCTCNGRKFVVTPSPSSLVPSVANKKFSVNKGTCCANSNITMIQGSGRIKSLTRSSGDFEAVANSFRITSARLNKSKSEVIRLKDVADVEHKEVERLGLSSGDMWALGVSIVIGGQYFAWNEGLHAGFGSLLIATVIIASGYICLVLCIAELSSALPFAGMSRA